MGRPNQTWHLPYFDYHILNITMYCYLLGALNDTQTDPKSDTTQKIRTTRESAGLPGDDHTDFIRVPLGDLPTKRSRSPAPGRADQSTCQQPDNSSYHLMTVGWAWI